MKLFYSLALLLLIGVKVNGQHYLGLANSNYSELNSIYLNPASLGDSRHGFQFHLFSFNAFFANDYMGIKSGKELRKYISNSGGRKFTDLLSYTDDGLKKRVDFFTEVRGPSLMFSLSPRHGIALGTRFRNLIHLKNANAELLSLAVRGFEDSNGSLYTGLVNNEDFSGNGHLFTETNLSYGAVLYNDKQHFLKGGITGKYLNGLGLIDVKNRDISIDFDYDPVRQEGSLVTRRAELDLTYTDNFQDRNFSFNRLFGSEQAGIGWGADLGLVYEYRPEYADYNYEMDGQGHTDHSANKYKFKISAAVTDVGRIAYKNKDITRKYSLASNNPVAWSQEDIDKIDFDVFESMLTSKYGSDFTKNRASSQVLPTTLNVQTDYRLTQNIYAGATFIQHLAGKRAPSMYNTLISVAPRFETVDFEASIPITYAAKHGQLNLGAVVRAGFFYIGSDNLRLFKAKNIKSGNVYLGFTFNLNKEKRKDPDKDMVSNKYDRCKSLAGPASNYGCPFPDSDDDGVFDKEDKCPSAFGDPKFGGCPDKDGDSITDSLDACPDIAGSAKTQGCPDMDNDGIADREDSCPEVPGVKEEKGCPVNVRVITEPVKEPVLINAVSNLEFTTGKLTIKPQSYPSLNKLAKLLIERQLKLTLIGYTDNTGTEELNLKISKGRAEAVKRYLVKQGVNPDRILTAGGGESDPVASNETAQGRQKNRRVEFKIE